MSSTDYGVLVLDVLGGVAALLIGIGVFAAMMAIAKTLARVRTTLDGVDRQLENLGTPVTSTLTRVDEVTKSLESTAGTLAKTADLTKSAVVPAIINIGATLSCITATVRRLITGTDLRVRE